MPDATAIAGFIGVAVVVAAYFANQQRWLRSEDWRFPLANLAGAALILVSLRAQWDSPAALVELIWIAVSLWGLVKSARERGRDATRR